jgi:hypothetical protein
VSGEWQGDAGVPEVVEAGGVSGHGGFEMLADLAL